MRFLRLRALRFGPLRDRALDLDGDAVVVFGHNESGKSSLRAALETILYGFDPASRDKHPLHAWDGGSGGDLHLEAELRLDSGEVQRVERVLQSTGKLRLATGSEPFRGRREGNRPLPWASLPREVFRAIYSLELEQLVALEGGVQGHVDDLLLPESPGLDLLAVAEVRSSLREEVRRLWRSDARGRPLCRELREKLADARRRAAEAAAADQALRATREELAGLEAQLERVRARKRALERARDDAPTLRALRELELRRRALGPPIDLAPLEGRPLADPRELARETLELEAGRRAHAERLAQPPVALVPAERALLARAAEIEAAAARAGRDASRSERAAELERRAAELRAEAERELARALAGPADLARCEALRGAPLEVLRSAQTSWARAFEEHAKTARGGLRPPAWLVALASCAAAAVLVGLLAGLPALWGAGAVTALAVFAVALLLLRAAGRAAPPPAAPEGVESLLAALGIPAELRATPADLARLIDALERVRGALGEAERCVSEARRLAAAAEEGERLARELCRATGVAADGGAEARVAGAEAEGRAERGADAPAADGAAERPADRGAAPAADRGAEARAARLRDALAAARAREREVERDRAERDRARAHLDATEPPLRARRAYLEAVERVLAAAEPGAGELGERYERVAARMREAEFVRRREAELRADPRAARLAADPRAADPAADPRGPRLDADPLSARLTADPRMTSDPRLSADARTGGDAAGDLVDPAALERELRECDAAIESARERAGRLRQRLSDAAGGRRAAAQDEIDEIEERLAAAERERDRLALLESIVARAEAAFRETHQPDVLRRASEYLRRVTEGRYTRLDYDAEARLLTVTHPERPEPLPVRDPISRGTLDQIFLCLRLGLLDHLDEERERLPFVLDDALVRTDDVRRPEVYGLLAHAASRRQVLVLTCQERLAREAEEAFKVRRIELSG